MCGVVLCASNLEEYGSMQESCCKDRVYDLRSSPVSGLAVSVLRAQLLHGRCTTLCLAYADVHCACSGVCTRVAYRFQSSYAGWILCAACTGLQSVVCEWRVLRSLLVFQQRRLMLYDVYLCTTE